MPLVPLNKTHTIGILKDIEDYELPIHAWSGGKNVRFGKNKVSSMPGYSEVYSGVTANDASYFHVNWRDGTDIWWIYHTGDKIYRMNDVGHTDVSQSGGYSGSVSSIYTGTVFNGVPIMNVGTFQDDPQQWDSGTSKFKDLDNWPANLYCKGMGAYKNFLMAYNLKDGSDEFPMAVQWSQPADPGTVPTSWDYTDLTKIAGRTPLAETQGPLLSMGTVGDVAIFYKDDAFIRCNFVGGQFIFDFDWIETERGILGTHAFAKFRDRHFVVSQGQFIITNGNEVEPIGEDKNVRFFFNTLNGDYADRTFCIPVYKQKEIMICYVNESEDADATFPNFALVWNWKYNTWTYKELGNEIPFGASGLVQADSDDIIDDQEQIIDTDDSIIDEVFATTSEEEVLLADVTNEKFYLLDDGTDFDGTGFTCEVERIGLPLSGRDEHGEPVIDPERNKFMRRVYPILEATSSVDFYFGVQRNVGGAVDWLGPFSFDPSTDTHIDFRLNGKFFATRISAASSVSWSFRGYKFDITLLGQGNR